jgi:hypothetical protein
VGIKRLVHHGFRFLGPPLIRDVTEPLWEHLKSGSRNTYTASIMELVEIFLSRKQEPQETDASILARLVNRQKHQVIPQSSLTHNTVGDGSISSKRLDRMLTIIIIPGNAVMSQESEELLTISHKPSTIVTRKFRGGAITLVPGFSALFLWFSSLTRLESAASGGGSLEC